MYFFYISVFVPLARLGRIRHLYKKICVKGGLNLCTKGGRPYTAQIHNQ